MLHVCSGYKNGKIKILGIIVHVVSGVFNTFSIFLAQGQWVVVICCLGLLYELFGFARNCYSGNLQPEIADVHGHLMKHPRQLV